MQGAFRTSYVSFDSDAAPPLRIAGKLSTPELAPGAAHGRAPAVVICHGSDGPDARGAFHAAALNAAGIATLEIDMWAARGVKRGAAARPGSPIETLADAFAAKRFLEAQPEIDPLRIGILGFSWGGVVSLLSATQTAAAAHVATSAPFKAHVAFYPVCWAYETVPGLSLRQLTGAPILIHAGETDAYDDPDGLDQLLARLPETARAHIKGVTHKGAGHGFDRDQPAVTIVDPFAHKGAGGPVVMAFHAEAAHAAREASVGFFLETL